jgi:hypothetical protein
MHLDIVAVVEEEDSAAPLQPGEHDRTIRARRPHLSSVQTFHDVGPIIDGLDASASAELAQAGLGEPDSHATRYLMCVTPGVLTA